MELRNSFVFYLLCLFDFIVIHSEFICISVNTHKRCTAAHVEPHGIFVTQQLPFQVCAGAKRNRKRNSDVINNITKSSKS